MEIHQGQGKVGDLYVVDTARLFPPSCPHLDSRRIGAVLYNQLRPEFVASYATQTGMRLSPDAFTGFGIAAMGEIDGELLNRQVYHATEHLLRVVVPETCRWLVRTKRTLDNSNLAPTLHARGVNLRFMGYMRRVFLRMTESETDVGDREFANSLGHALLMEMVARQMKFDLRLCCFLPFSLLLLSLITCFTIAFYPDDHKFLHSSHDMKH